MLQLLHHSQYRQIFMETLSNSIEIRCNQCKNKLSKPLRLPISLNQFKDNWLTIPKCVKDQENLLKLWMKLQSSNSEESLNRTHLNKSKIKWFSPSRWTPSQISSSRLITFQMLLRKFRNKCPNNLLSSTILNNLQVDPKLATEMIVQITGALKQVNMQVRALKVWSTSSRSPDVATWVTIAEPRMFRESTTLD